MVKTYVLKFKKSVAVFMAMLIMALLFSYTANNRSDAANSSRTYRVYNATTGRLLRTYTLAPLETSYNARSIIDPDERVIDWTKSGVVKIMFDSYDFCSGFVVDKHTIATAAHCVYDFTNGTSESISEILLFDTSGNVKQHIIPVEYHVPKSFIDATAHGKYSTTSDYALITVKEDLSEYMCFNLGVPLDSFVNGNATITATGFPEEYNDYTNHMKYSGNGKVLGGDPYGNLIYYDIDTTPGNSGGPVYLTESLQGRTYYTVVAINISGISYNIGTRMTTDLIHFYKSNDNIKY